MYSKYARVMNHFSFELTYNQLLLNKNMENIFLGLYYIFLIKRRK
jgi:hypothetical protein